MGRRLKEEEEARKAKEDRALRRAAAIEQGQDLAELGLEESEEEIKIDDLPIDQLIPESNKESENYQKLDNFIMIGFP